MKRVFFSLFIAVSLFGCKKDEQTINSADSATVAENLDETAALNVKKKFNIKANASVDLSQEIQALMKNDQKLYFPKGKYIINEVINISNVKNLSIIGEAGTVFETTRNNKVFQVSGNIKNLEIRGVKFVSSRESTYHDTEGLIFFANYGANDVMDGILIKDCTFTNAKTHANAIKLVSEGVNALAKNIQIINNRFESVGRMGVELQNHNNSQIKARYRDYTISNNSFYDVGTIQAWPAPVCISVTGFAENGKINNNKISEMRMQSAGHIYYGIENAGTVNLETIGNQMTASKYGFTGILGSGPTLASSAASGQPVISNWTIKNNTIKLSGSTADKNKIRGMELSNAHNYIVSDNTIDVDGMAVMFVNSKNAKITGNKMKAVAPNVLYFKGESTGNTLTQNVIDGSEGEDHGTVMFYGASVRDNVAYGNKVITSGGRQGSYVNLAGANNSVN